MIASAKPKVAQPATTSSRTSALAEWGRKEIAIAETEMPGLMATRAGIRRRAAAQGRAHRRLAAHDHPDRGADRDAEALGADVRWASCNIYSTQDHAAAAIAAAGTPVFAVKGETPGGLLGLHRTASSNGRDGGTPNMILDDGGDATCSSISACAPRTATRRSSTSRATKKKKSSSR